MNCILLTKREFLKGEQVFKQIEKEKEKGSKVECFDIIRISLFIGWSIINDWNNSDIIGKSSIIVIFSPIIYILLSAFHIINC